MLSGAAFIIRDVLESGGPVARARSKVAWAHAGASCGRPAPALVFATPGLWASATTTPWVSGWPDRTDTQPRLFGANIAAPMLVDVFAAIDSACPAPRTPPQRAIGARLPAAGFARRRRTRRPTRA